MKDSLIKNKLLGKTIPISKIDHTINAQRASKAGPLGTISRESSYTPGSPLVGANALYLSERPLRGESEGPFFNFTFDKGRLKNLVSWTLQHYGHYKTVELLEQLKKTGFEYATKAGISLGIDDLKIPPKKHVLLLSAEQLTKVTSQQYQRGDITAIERFQRLIDTWHRTSEQLKQEVISHFEETDILNPVYMMAFSGARGNISQVRQLVGMRGLMSDPQGQIIDFPIQSNFREGLTLTEYIISSYGARKGIVDTALRTANAGYLTRRLVDVAQHVIISHYDCGTKKGIFLLDMKEGNKTIVSARTRIIGRVLARDIYKPKTNIKIFSRNQEITTDVAFEITKYTNKVFVRSALTCNTTKLICQLCYGWSLAQGNLVSVGETVGVIAAQSIGEPGTQLTMRTFHTGGVFSGDVSDEIRAPYNGFVHYDNIIPGILIRTLDGKIGFLTKSDGFLFFSLNKKLDLSSDIKKYKIPPYTLLLVRNGESVIQKQVVAQITSIGSLQTTKRDTAELVIKSDFEGLFYAKNLQIKKSIIGPKPKFMGPGKEKLVMDPKAMEIVVKARGWNFAWVLSGKRYEIPLLLKSFPRIGDYITKQTIMARHYSAVDNQLSTRATRETTADNVFAAHRANKAEVLYLKTYKTKLKGLFIFENFQKLRLFRRAKNYKQIVNGFYTKFSHVKSFKYFKSDFALLKADLGQQPARYKFGARLPQSGTQRGSAQRAKTLFPDMLLPQRGNDDVNQSTYSQRFLAAPLVNSAFAPSAISYPPGAAQRAPLGNILPQRGPEGGTKYIAYKKIKYHKIGYFQFLNTRLIIFPKNYNFLFFDFQPDCTPSGFGLRASSSFQPAGLDFFENIPYTEFKFNYNFINSHVFFSASSFKKDSKHKPSILLKRFKPKTDLFFSLSPVGPKLLPLCGTQNVVAVKLNKPFGPKRGFSHFEKTRLVRTDFAFCKASFIKTLQNNILSVNVLKNSTVTQKTNVLTIDGLSKKTQTRLNHLINTYKTIKCFKKQYKFYKNVIHYKKAHKQGYTSINYHRRGAAKGNSFINMDWYKQQPKGAESFINSSSHHFLKNQQTSYQTLLVKSWLNNKNNVVHSLPAFINFAVGAMSAISYPSGLRLPQMGPLWAPSGATKKRRPFGQYIAHKNTLVLNKFNKAPILSIFEKNQILITSNEPLLTKLNKKAQFKKGFLFGFSKAQKIDFLNFGTISYPPGPLWAHISLKSAPFGVPILAKQELSDRDVLPLGPQRISACTNQSIFVENVSKIKIFEYSKIFATDIRKKCILKHFNVGVTTNLAFQPAIYAQRAINKIQKYEQKQHTKIKAALKNIVKDNAKTPNTFVSQKLLINKNHLCLISNYFALKKTNFKTVNNILHTEITLSCPPEPKGLASLSESQTTRAQRASLYSYPEGGAKRPEGGAKRPEGAPEVGACTNPSERRERQTTHVFTKNWCNTLYSRLNKLFFSYMIVYNTQKITKKTKLKIKKLLLNKGTKKLVYLFKDNVLLSERNNQVFFACINKEKGAPLGPLQPLRSLPKGPLWLSRCPVGAKAIYARRGNAGRDALWAYIAGHPEGLLCPPEGAKAEGGNILGNADRDKTVWVYKTRRIVSQIKTAFSPISYPFGAPFGQYKAHNQNIVTYPGKSSVDNLVFYNNKINPHFNISMKMLSKLETKNAVSKQKPYPIFEVVKQIGRSYTTQTTFTQPQRATYCALQGALGASSPAKRDFLVTPKGAQRAAKREKHVVPQRGMGPKMSANKPSEPQKAPEGLPPGPLEVPERAFRQTSIPDPAVVRDLNKLFKTEILKQNFVWIKNKKPRFLPKQLEKQKQASSFNSPGGAEGSIGYANRSTNSYPFGAGGAVTEINIFSNSYLYNIFSCFVLDLWSNISPQEHTSFSENQLLSILHILLSSCAEVQKNLTQLVELTLGVSSFGKDFIGHPKGAKAFAPASGVSAQSAFSPKVGANTLEKIINSFKLLKKNLKQIVIKTTSTYILFRPLPEILFLDKFKKFVLHKKIFHKLRKKNNSTKFISDWQSTICYHPGQRGPEGQQYLSRLFKGAREAEGSYPRNMFASLKGPTVKKIYYPKGGAFVQGIYSQRTGASINRWEYIENFIKAKQKRDLNLLPKSPITYQLSKSGGPVAFAPFQPSGHILPRGLKGSSVSVTNVPLTLSYPSGLRGSIGNKFPGFQPFGHILRGRRASRVSSFRRGKSNNCKINKSWKHFGETNYFSPYQGELLYTKPYKTYLDLNPYENLKTGLKNAYLPLWATSLSESPKGLAGFILPEGAVGQYIAGFGGSKGYPENLKKTKEEKIRIKMFQYYLKTLNRQKTSHQKGWSRCSLILTKTDLITLNYVGSSEQNRTIFSEIKIPSCFNSPEGVTDGVTNVPKISYEQAFLNNLVKPSLKNNNQFTTLSQLNKTYHFNKTYCFNMKKLWLTHSVTKIYKLKFAIYESLLCPPGRVYQIKTRVPVKSKTSKQIGNYISPSSVCYQMPLWTERIEQLFVPKGQTQYIAQRGPKGKTTKKIYAYITNVTKKLEKDTKIYYSSFLCIKLKLWFKTKNKPCFKTKQLQPYFERTNFKWLFLKQKNLRIKNKVGFFFLKGSYFVPGYILPSGLKAPKDILPPMAINQEKARYLEPWRANNASYTNVITFGGRLLNKKTYDFRSLESKITFELQKFHLNGYFLTLKPEYDKTFFALKVILNSLSNAFISAQGAYLDFIGPPEGAKAIYAQKGIAVYKNTIFSNLQNIDKSHVLLIKRQKFSMLKPINYNTFSYTHKEINYCKSFEALSSPSEKALWDRLRLIYNMLRITSIYKNKNFIFTEARSFGRFAPEGNSLPISSDALRCPPKGRQYITAFLSESRQLCAQSLSDSYVAYLFNPERPMRDDKQVQVLKKSGQLVHMNKQKITLRIGQPLVISPRSIIHNTHGDFINNKTTVITLTYEQLKTGDIVQGIPKIEQLFEARTTKRGRLFRDNISNLLTGLFLKYFIKSTSLLSKNSIKLSSLKVVSSLPQRGPFAARDREAGQSERHISFWRGNNVVTFGPNGTKQNQTMLLALALQWSVKQSFYKIQQIIVDGILRVYRSQGVSIADKHVEIIVKQMTSKVRIINYNKAKMNDYIFSLKNINPYFVKNPQRAYIVDKQGVPVLLQQPKRKEPTDAKTLETLFVSNVDGATGLFPGEIVDHSFVLNINTFLLKTANVDQLQMANSPESPFAIEPIKYEPIVLGITRASLEVDSFLSAASFQQTTKVLSQAALYKKKDFLKGLKENIIIGNLIPAGTGYLSSPRLGAN